MYHKYLNDILPKGKTHTIFIMMMKLEIRNGKAKGKNLVLTNEKCGF